jgi:NADPH:quinone reductase
LVRWPHTLARWNGASVVGTVRRTADVEMVDTTVCDSVIAFSRPSPAEAVREVTSEGAVIAAYASQVAPPAVPFRPLSFTNVTLRMMGSDDFPSAAQQLAIQGLTAAAAAGALDVAVAERDSLIDVANSHDRVDADARG